MKTTHLLLLALAVVTGGCSILYDTDPYRTGSGDAGPGGDMDVAGPSAPTLEITPDTPTTRDNLNVMITTASVDPMGDTVTYEYEWVTGSLTVTTDFVQSSDTVAGQTWTLTVTPTAGGRRGTPGTAMVTIGNTPPSISHAGIDTYEPWPDDVIEAFVGDEFDADMQSTLLRYEWFINGSPVGSNTDELNLGPLNPSPGAEVTVRVTISDTVEDGNSITVGPAIVRSPFGWRPLRPDTTSRFLPETYFPDPDHQRFLMIRDGELWEYSTTDGEEGWARLLTGLPVLQDPAIFRDAPRDRFIIFGGIDNTSGTPTLSNAMYELSVPQRGSEEWRTVPMSGLRPSPRALMGYTTDAVSQRGFVYGGGESMAMPYAFDAVGDDLWELDLTANDPAFSLVMDGSPPGELLGPMMVVSDDGARAFIMGGFTNTVSFDATDAVHELDLTPSVQFSGINVTLENDTGLAGVVPDPRGGGAYLFFGGENIPMPTAEIQRFDYGTRTTVAVTAAIGLEPAIAPALLPVGFHTTTGRIMLATMGFQDDEGFTVYEFAPGDTEVTLISTRTRHAHTAPPAVDLASVVYSSRGGPDYDPVMLFGRNPRRDASGTAWRWTDGEWERADDPTWEQYRSFEGAAEQTFEDDFSRDYVGGFVGNPETEVFTILEYDGQTTTLAPAQNNPTLVPMGLSELRNVIYYDAPDSCSLIVDHRAYDPIRNEFWAATTAAWVPLPGPTMIPTGRDQTQFVSLTAANGDHRIIVFGGNGGGASLSDVYTIDPCLGTMSAVDTSVPSTGTPSARRAGAMTRDYGTFLGGVNRSRGFLFGGAAGDIDADVSMAGVLNDLHAVVLNNDGTVTWTEMADGGERPVGRGGHVIFWDTPRGRLIMHGGRGPKTVIVGDSSGAQWRADTWEYRPQ